MNRLRTLGLAVTNADGRLEITDLGRAVMGLARPMSATEHASYLRRND